MRFIFVAIDNLDRRLVAIFYFPALCFFFLFPSCNPESHDVSQKAVPVDASPISIKLKCVLPKILKESSGLCYTDGNLWTFGDSGNPNEIFKIDSSTGIILQTVQIDNFPNIDWEDITADSSFIYIGDFGNNNGNRTDLKIIRIKKTDLNVSGTLS